ncbi:MAG: manganese efflux pump MntP family protein [Eubacteriaceae bacterium]|jgi:putative Mn2+ efflux pump MntP|nr:manganese efflux pump MntP family protein [Eubacteriaceae bacterium]MDD4507673.1 manganese efflux pump MntP family protein [Eubacteriaceae bacterium]
MGLVELILLAIGLAMDAFAISVCKGLALKKAGIREGVICGLWFGGAQGLMPLIGYLLGTRFENYIQMIAPWIAFGLLCLIGANMIRESLSSECDTHSACLDVKTMFLLAVATSIDALAVGITFACVPVTVLPASQWLNTVFAVILIGVVTFVLSGVGVKAGSFFGARYKSKAERFGGIILILLGLKILLEALL